MLPHRPDEIQQDLRAPLAPPGLRFTDARDTLVRMDADDQDVHPFPFWLMRGCHGEGSGERKAQGNRLDVANGDSQLGVGDHRNPLSL